MSLPSGLIFFLDFVFSPNLGASNTMADRFGNLANKSIYGGDRVGAEITGGLNLVSSSGDGFSGPRTVGARGYAYSSPSGSANHAASADNQAQVAQFDINSASAEQKKLLQWDPDLLALSGNTGASGRGYKAIVFDLAHSDFVSAQADFNNLGAFEMSASMLKVALGAVGGYAQVRRCTTVVPAGSNPIGGATQSALTDQAKAVRMVLIGLSASVTTVTVGGVAAVTEVPTIDDIVAGGAVGSVIGQATWGLEGNPDIPEIDIKVDSVAVTAQTKKLKAKWTPELGQDLNAYHNLDAEVELTSILSEQVALEIDREILADLVNGATASTYYWARAPGLFVNRVNGTEVGAASAAPDFTGTVSEWYETLIETINDVSAQIHRKTLRGGANFIVCGPEVANILEFTAGFRASVTADDETGSVGAVKTGSLSKKFDVIVDPYFLRNVILVGRRGSSFLESGYVYAPYVPLQTTPTIFGPEDFVPRKGVMTRYAKKMVRPDMYGLVIVRGLLGEAGATS
jgi:hypothetical protein